MQLSTIALAASLLVAATAQAAAANPARVPGCAAPGGISRVSTQATTCCGTLPCQRPLSFRMVPPPRRIVHT